MCVSEHALSRGRRSASGAGGVDRRLLCRPPLGRQPPPETTTAADQWRIQDFPQGGAPTSKIAIIFQIFAENCMKMKEFGPPGGARVPGAPLGSANADGTHPTGMHSCSQAVRTSCVHTKGTRNRKLSLMSAVSSLIFFAFAPTFAWCERTLTLPDRLFVNLFHLEATNV